MSCTLEGQDIRIPETVTYIGCWHPGVSLKGFDGFGIKEIDILLR